MSEIYCTCGRQVEPFNAMVSWLEGGATMCTDCKNDEFKNLLKLNVGGE